MAAEETGTLEEEQEEEEEEEEEVEVEDAKVIGLADSTRVEMEAKVVGVATLEEEEAAAAEEEAEEVREEANA